MSTVLSSRAGSAIAALTVIAAVVMMFAVFVGPSDGRRSGPPLDPRSTTDSGTRAAVILMEQHGRRVSIGAPGSAAGTVLMFTDDLEDDSREQLLDQISDGQSLIIADASSPLLERVNRAATIGPVQACSLPSLSAVSDLDLGLIPTLASGDIASCFAVGDGWLVTVSSHGAGQIVAISSPRPFTNGRLAQDHHAALILGVVQLTDGPIRIVYGAAGFGDRSLADLIGEPVWAALASLLLCVVLYGLFRARRLGLPVTESDPVEIEGSELVLATARLYARTHSDEYVLQTIADRLRIDIEHRWGFSVEEEPGTVIDRLHLNDADGTHIRVALGPRKPADAADFAQRVAHGVYARRIVRGSRDG